MSKDTNNKKTSSPIAPQEDKFSYINNLVNNSNKILNNKAISEESKKYSSLFENSLTANQLGKTQELLPGDVKNITGGADYEKVQDILGQGYNIFDGSLNVRKELGNKQSGLAQIGGALNQAIVGEIVGGTIEGTGRLLDIKGSIDLYNGNIKEFDNTLTEIGSGLKGWAEHSTPIFGSEEMFTSGGWWAKGLVTTASSLSLLIPAMGAVKAVGGLGRALGVLKSMETLSTAGRTAAWLRTGISQAVVSRHMENWLEAREVWDNTLNEYVNNKGLSLEEAEQAASKAVRQSYVLNTAMLTQDLFQYLLIGKKTFGSSEASDKIMAALGKSKSSILGSRAKSLGINMASEGFEEAYQYVVGNEVVNYQMYKDGLASNPVSDKFLSGYMKDNEFWTSVIFGALGAGVHSGVGKMFNKAFYSKKLETNDNLRIENFKKTQEIQKRIYNKLAKAYESNNQEAVESAIEELTYLSALNSYEFGNSDIALETMGMIKGASNEELVAMGLPEDKIEEFKSNIDNAINQTKDIFKKLKKNSKIFGDEVNKEVTTTELQLEKIDRLINNSEKNITEKRKELEKSQDLKNLSPEEQQILENKLFIDSGKLHITAIDEDLQKNNKLTEEERINLETQKAEIEQLVKEKSKSNKELVTGLTGSSYLGNVFSDKGLSSISTLFDEEFNSISASVNDNNVSSREEYLSSLDKSKRENLESLEKRLDKISKANKLYTAELQKELAKHGVFKLRQTELQKNLDYYTSEKYLKEKKQVIDEIRKKQTDAANQAINDEKVADDTINSKENQNKKANEAETTTVPGFNEIAENLNNKVKQKTEEQGYDAEKVDFVNNYFNASKNNNVNKQIKKLLDKNKIYNFFSTLNEDSELSDLEQAIYNYFSNPTEVNFNKIKTLAKNDDSYNKESDVFKAEEAIKEIENQAEKEVKAEVIAAKKVVALNQSNEIPETTNNSVETNVLDENEDVFESDIREYKKYDERSSSAVSVEPTSLSWRSSSAMDNLEEDNDVELTKFLENPSIDITEFSAEFEIDEDYLKQNKTLLDKLNSGETLTQEDINNVPIKVYFLNKEGNRVKTRNNEDLFSYLHANDFWNGKNIQSVNPEDLKKELSIFKFNILKKLNNNEKAISKITHQKDGILQEDYEMVLNPATNVKERKLIFKPLSEAIALDENEIEFLFGDSFNNYISGNAIDQELLQHTTATPGALYIKFKKPNGTSFPARVFVRRLDNNDVNALFSILNYAYAQNQTLKTEISKLTPELQKELNSSQFVKDLISVLGPKATLLDVLNNFVYEGKLSQGKGLNELRKVGNDVFINGNRYNVVDFTDKQDKIKAELAKKMINISAKKLNQASYKKILIDNNVVQTHIRLKKGYVTPFSTPTTVISNRLEGDSTNQSSDVNERFNAESTQSTQESDIEAKKAEIERRRQEDLSKNKVEYGGINLKSEAIEVSISARPAGGFAVTVNLPSKNTNTGFLNSTALSQEFETRQEAIDYVNETIIPVAEQKINAKYDEELAKLNESKQPNNTKVDEIKADIERIEKEKQDLLNQPNQESKVKEVTPSKVDTYLSTPNQNGSFNSSSARMSFIPAASIMAFESIGDNKFAVYISKNNDAVKLALQYPDRNIDPVFETLSAFNPKAKEIQVIKPAIVELQGDKYVLVEKGLIDYDSVGINKSKETKTKPDTSKIDAQIAQKQAELKALEQSNEVVDKQSTATEVVKKVNVEELFNSNPELANQVYEALGFDSLITPNDKIVFGHPGIGKTYLRDSGKTNVIDFDSDYKSKINEKFNLPKGFKARNDFQKSNKEEYQQAIRELWNEAKQEANKTGKQLFASDMILLREFANDFDKVITMSKETFIERAKQRNDYTPGLEGTEGWKNSLDIAIANVDKSKVFTTDKYLSDLFITPQQKQEAQQKFQEYVNANGKKDIKGFKEFVKVNKKNEIVEDKNVVDKDNENEKNKLSNTDDVDTVSEFDDFVLNSEEAEDTKTEKIIEQKVENFLKNEFKEEVEKIAEEENLTVKEVEQKVKDNLNNKNLSSFSKSFKNLIDKIKKLILTLFVSGSIIAGTSSFSLNTDGTVSFDAFSNIEVENVKQWATRFLDKQGLIEIADNQIVKESSLPKIVENIKPQKIFEIIGSVPDSYNSSDTLLSYRSQWDNSEGFRYIPVPVRKDLPKGGMKISGVVGVGHFLLDASVSDKTYSHENNKVYLRDAKRNNDWIPAFEKNKDNSVTLKYKKSNDLIKNDIIVSPLRQFKFTDIDFNNSQKAEGFKSSVKEVKTKDGKGTYLIFKNKDGYSRFSGGSVVFIFNDSYGNTIVRDFAGSVNQIKLEGENITNSYNLNENDLVIGYHDVGSFSAKPKAKNNEIDTQQWSGFNPNGETGGALLIPTEGNINNSKSINSVFSTKKTPQKTDNDKLNEAVEVLNKILPKEIAVTIQDDLIKIFENGDAAVASFSKAGIILSSFADDTDAFHEAFHAVFRVLLNGKERNSILESSKNDFLEPTDEQVKMLMDRHNLSKEEATDLYYEEILADEFGKYMSNPNEYTFNNKEQKSFFEKLLSWINNILGIKSNREKVFSSIRKGNYSNSKQAKDALSNLNVNSTETAMFNNEVSYMLKSVEILQSDKAKQVFAKAEKNNWDLNKTLTELQIPKEQKQLILDLGINNREELISNVHSKQEVSELFDSNSELANIGTPEQYSQYLDTIFPDSKVKDIVYHFGTSKIINKFNKGLGILNEIYFTNDSEGKNIFYPSDGKPKNKAGRTEVILNIKLPRYGEQEKIFKTEKDRDVYFNNLKHLTYLNKKVDDLYEKQASKEEIKKAIDELNNFKESPYEYTSEFRSTEKQKEKPQNTDGLVLHKPITGLYTDETFFVVFEPEQIHILGSKKDIEGFKEFVKQPQKPNLIEQLALELASKYSYAVEVNTAKDEVKDYDMVDVTGEGNFEPREFIPDTDFVEEYDEDGNIIGMKEILSEKGKNQIKERENKRKPTQYYANLTVPGGTNYIENEISTPLITPSIKGHAQFATDKGIGWFRSDDKKETVIQHPDILQLDKDYNEGKITKIEFQDRSYELSRKGISKVFSRDADLTKTRRILEVQSDLFQKGRDKESLIPYKYSELKIKLPYGNELNHVNDKWVLVRKPNNEEKQKLSPSDRYNPNYYIKEILSDERGIELFNAYKGANENSSQYEKSDSQNNKNKFLQLLNKDSNWVTFFIKSIIQDSAKKGYEKVLFPSGNTASKVEGHTTLEDFKRDKENRLKTLETQYSTMKNVEYENVKESTIQTKEQFEEQKQKDLDNNRNELTQLKQELKRVETEGFGALKPIYNFYENTVTNILNKTYGKDNVKVITDEYGNTWNEVTVKQSRDLSPIVFKTKNRIVESKLEQLSYSNYFEARMNKPGNPLSEQQFNSLSLTEQEVLINQTKYC